MSRSQKTLFIIMGLLIFSIPQLSAEVKAQGKLRFSISAISVPTQYLPVLAAEEKGFWRKQGLSVEFIPARGTTAMLQALTAGYLDAGADLAAGLFPGISRGVPLVIVSSLTERADYQVWVNAKGLLVSPADLKGKKMAVTSFGGTIHVMTQVAIKQLGLEKDVRFVATGGVPTSIAAFKSGTVDALVSTLRSMIKLKLAGEARELLEVADYMPGQWTAHVLFSHRELAKKSPALVKNAASVILETTRFLRSDEAWTIARLKSQWGYSDEEARLIYEKDLPFTRDGKVDPQGLQNIRNTLIELRVISKEKMPEVEQFFSPVLVSG